MKVLLRFCRFVFVGAGVIALTSLGIDATQYFEGSNSALSILTQEVLEESCPLGMVNFVVLGEELCVDMYEASPDNDCDFAQPLSVTETANNLNNPNCAPVSIAAATPWTNVTKQQAAGLCARAGKQLPNNQEWYQAALGTADADTVCNIAGSLSKTGAKEQCLSGAGSYDHIGNVWEWVHDEVAAEATQPASGYVAAVGIDGVAITTATSAQALFNDDYFWANEKSQTAVTMRGGFYGSGSDAGIYTVHSDLVPNFAGSAIGFRCVSRL